MRLRELLQPNSSSFVNEVIDVVEPSKVDWTASPGNKAVIANWTDKSGVEVRTVFTKISPGVADLAFARKDAQGQWSFKRTGTGKESSANIFGGVASNIKDYLAKNPDITHITFGASDDPDRARLYSKMSQRAGVLGLEPVSPKDKAVLPPEYARLQRDMKQARVRSQALNQIPTLTKTPAGTPTLAKDQTYSKKYDQFMLKRISAPAAPSGGGGSSKLPLPSIPFSPGGGGGRNMHDNNPFKIPFS
jgi:hypothetical protein